MSCTLFYLDCLDKIYLLLTELPEMVNVFNTNYKLHYSSSYSGTTQGTCASVDYNFCMPLVNAIETLLEGSYNAFLLTAQCNTVGIYCTTDGKYKIFDSHARDSCGMVDLKEPVYCWNWKP